MMPTMAAAYSTLSRAAVPRATSQLNVINRVGGSLGTALLAVVLQGQIAAQVPGPQTGDGGIARLPEDVRAQVAEPLADAFSHTFAYAVALTLVALVPAVILARTERRARAAAAAAALQAEPARSPA
jgi:NADH:ubiquinone oxidoreductase subunit 6 (subunit J)